jgi:peptidylprolyl isomerase
MTEQTLTFTLDTGNDTGGDVVIRLRPDLAPGHVARITELASEGFYDGVVFHRVIPGFMAQGGDPTGTGTSGSKKPNLKAEFSAEPHVRGVCSMARTNDPNSAGSQFFICLERVPHLDGQYTAFGKTADEASLAVVKAIGVTPTDSGDRPKTPVKVNKATVVAKAK